MKKILCLILVITMVLSNLLIPAYGLEFSDISGHWAEDRINDWKDQGWVVGYGNGTYGPQDKVKQEDFSKMVMNRLSIEIEGDETLLTRLQACFTAHDILMELGYEENEIEDILEKFIDTDEISGDERKEVNLVVSKGIIKGYKDDTLRLENTITRAEALVVIDRILELAPDDEIEESQAYITSDKYSVSGSYIKNIPFDVSYDTFTSNIEANAGSTYEIYKFDGLTKATRISEGYKVIVKSNKGTAEKTYTIDKNANPRKEKKTEIAYGTGTENDPYRIYYIEDLASIGTTNTAIGLNYGLDDNYILVNNLDFENRGSYRDADGTSHGDLNGDGVTQSAILECTSGPGWKPIAWGESIDNFTALEFPQLASTAYSLILEDVPVLEFAIEFRPENLETVGFKGTFDGNDKKIIKLFIDRSSDGDERVDRGLISRERDSNIGLFGTIFEGGIIKDLGIVDVNITGNYKVGALAGYVGNMNEIRELRDEIPTVVSGAKINRCYSSGSVNGREDVGGLVGQVRYSEISNSYADVDVSGYGGIGGLAGLVSKNSNISNCHASGDITADHRAGGLVGKIGCTTVSACYATGDILYNEDYDYDYDYENRYGLNGSGGLTGSANNSFIEKSYATGSILQGNQCIGGFIGAANDTTISDAYATGDVWGEDEYIGGFIGRLYNSDIDMTYSTGDVTGENNIGGFIGSVEESELGYNLAFAQNVTATSAAINAGEFIGYIDSEDYNWDTMVVYEDMNINFDSDFEGTHIMSFSVVAPMLDATVWEFDVDGGQERPTLVGVGDDDGMIDWYPVSIED